MTDIYMDSSDKANLIKEYELGQTNECPFCGGENLEHTCQNCYSVIDKDVCWKYKSYCEKCSEYIRIEIPKIEALKIELGVACKCNEPNCSKCLIANCKDDNCPVHTMEHKIQRRKKLGEV